MTNYRSWTPRQKAQYILDALSDKNISGEMLGLIQGWLLSDDNAAAKQEEIDLLFDRLFAEYGKPGKRTYELLAQLHERYGLPPVAVPAGKRASLGRRVLVRAAAVLVPVLIAAGAALLVLNRPGEVDYITVEAADSFREITLPDGSVVRIAPGSELQYADKFTGKRSVKLSGEAFFAVEKMPAKPFTVETEHLMVTVLGTEFNMTAWPGKTGSRVALASGRVEVKAGNHVQILAPMQQFVYDNATGAGSVVQFSALEADRWKGRNRVLENVSVRKALEMTGEFYGVRIAIDDTLRLDGRVIRTTLSSESSLEDALYAIQTVAKNFEHSIDGDTVTVTTR